MLVFHVSVNRSNTPKEMLYAEGGSTDFSRDDDTVVDAMPRVQYTEGEVGIDFFFEDVEVCLFPLENPKKEDIQREFEKRGLIPDPYALARVNKVNPGLVKTHNHATQWNRDGKFHCIAFHLFSSWSYREVCETKNFVGTWWFAGSREISSL